MSRTSGRDDLGTKERLAGEIRGFEERLKEIGTDLVTHEGVLPKDQFPGLVGSMVEVLIRISDYLDLVAHLFHDHQVAPDYAEMDELTTLLFNVDFQAMDDGAVQCFPCNEVIHAIAAMFLGLIDMYEEWLNAKPKPNSEGHQGTSERKRAKSPPSSGWKEMPLGVRPPRPKKAGKFIVIVFTDPVQVFEFRTLASAEAYVGDLAGRFPGVRTMISQKIQG